MNLNDLLKVNNVRCIKTKVDEDLVEGKTYKLEGFDDETIKIVDHRAFSSWHNKNLFEPVLNNDVSKSDNEIDTSLDSVDKPQFKVGDRHSRAKEIKDEIIGRTYKSKNFGLFTVTDYQNSKSVFIRFNDTGYEVKTSLKSVIEGGIKDRLSPTVYGVGILGNKYPTKIKGERLKEYALWYEMLKRCYSENHHKNCPTYSQCKASENFKNYSYFYEWCQAQIGFNNTGWCLDKDLLVRGNKTYSESNCVFIPEKINNALIKSDKARGLYPIGVCIDKVSGNFYAQVNNGSGCQVNLGRFTDHISAFNAYKEAKERYLADLAEQYKEQIDPRAYKALLDYEVSIDD